MGRGLGVVDGQRVAYSLIDGGALNSNSWMVVVANDRPEKGTGRWSREQLLTMALAVLLLVVVGWGIASNERGLRHAANTDPLTGLANRRALDASIQQMLRSPRGAGGLALIDLDRFKEVNDRHGHHLGDQLLLIVAQRLRSCVREGDLVARLGGDEFGLVLPGIESEAAAADVAQRVVESICSSVQLGDAEIEVGVSVGLALVGQHGTDIASLLRSADRAMYQAKSSGGGWSIKPPLSDDESSTTEARPATSAATDSS